MFNYEIEYS